MDVDNSTMAMRAAVSEAAACGGGFDPGTWYRRGEVVGVRVLEIRVAGDLEGARHSHYPMPSEELRPLAELWLSTCAHGKSGLASERSFEARELVTHSEVTCEEERAASAARWVET